MHFLLKNFRHTFYKRVETFAINLLFLNSCPEFPYYCSVNSKYGIT